MPPSVILFWALLFVTAGGAMRWGGAPERIGAGLLATAALATVVVRSADGYAHVQLAVFVVDAALFVGLAVLAARADRSWPTWCASLQLVTTSAHLVKLINPATGSTAYAILAMLSAIPTVALLGGGVVSHQRRKRGSGFDRSWIPWPKSRTWDGAGGR